MPCRFQVFLAFFLGFYAAFLVQGKTAPEEKLDAFLSKKMKKAGLIGLQASRIKNGKLDYSGSFGLLNSDTHEPINDQTLFMIASCSKPITALGILKLYDQGKLHLDDPIHQHLPFGIVHPDFPNATITIRMLLSHVSSLKDNWDVMDPLYTVESGGDSPILLAEFVTDYFTENGKYYNRNNNFQQKPPGKYFEYCNMGYAVLGLIIIHASGKSFTEFFGDEIFGPLSMHNSYWFWKEIPHSNIAHPHDVTLSKASLQIKVLPHYGYPDYPDGQLRTTTEDYARFLEMLLHDGKVDDFQFLQTETVEEFFKIQFPSVNKHQAIAWNYNEFEKGMYYLMMPRLPSHTGGDPGVTTVVSINRKKKSAGIIFTNSQPYTFNGGKIVYLNMMKRLLK